MPSIAAVRYALEWNLLLALTAFLAFAAFQGTVDMEYLTWSFSAALERQAGMVWGEVSTAISAVWNAFATLGQTPDELLADLEV